MSQENSLGAIINKQEWLFFLFFMKSENTRAEQILLGGGVGDSRSGEEVRKGCGRVNIVQILCTHVCKCKNDTR
jgi:hypothetical protein